MRQDLSSSQFNRSLLKTRGQAVTQNVQTVEPKVWNYDAIHLGCVALRSNPWGGTKEGGY